MSQFLDTGGRFKPIPGRLMSEDGVYLTGPVRLYTDKQKAELEAQGVNTSHFTEITAADIEEDA